MLGTGLGRPRKALALPFTPPRTTMAATTLSGEQELIKFTGIIEEEII